MMRYYCDVCEDELVDARLTDRVANRIKRCLGDVRVEVMVAFKGACNKGNICEKCVLRVVADGDETP